MQTFTSTIGVYPEAQHSENPRRVNRQNYRRKRQSALLIWINLDVQWNFIIR